ncbi:MAG: hypothetical protein WEB37_12000 [Bacteroidota bacterium]
MKHKIKYRRSNAECRSVINPSTFVPTCAETRYSTLNIASEHSGLKLITLVVMLILSSNLSYSQDSLKTKQSRASSPSQFIDKNANGIDDRSEGLRKRKGMDRFVDKDGDGIADDRARGMGFKRGAGTATSPPDGFAPGGKRHRGGKQ